VCTDEGSRFRIDPDPPVAGQAVSVTYLGPAREVEWQVDDGSTTRVQPDANGEFQIDPLPSGRSLMLSDNLGLPGYLQARIHDTFR
jgi:hypothetical protein